MDTSSLQPDGPLPNDVPTLQALLRQMAAENERLRVENERLKAENAALQGQVQAAAKHRYGRRSERERPARTGTSNKRPKKRHPHGRSPIPANLERREVLHDLSEEEKVCPCCGKKRACIGEHVTEQLEMEPIRFFVLRTIKKTYACHDCDPQSVPSEQRFQTAGPERVGPIPKGLCGPTLLAHTITAKFADHTPLNRLAEQLARSGVHIARATLGDWLRRAADLLRPLVQLMHRRLLLSRVIHSDDTTVKLRVEGADSTSKSHLWIYIGDADYPYVLFDFTADYTATGPKQFLAGYRGYLQADALAQYECLYGEDAVKHVCCWAHARRKFVAAVEGGEACAQVALDLIGQLYAIEHDLPLLLLPSNDEGKQEERRQREEQRQQQRQSRATPVLEKLKQWLDEERPKVLPKSTLGEAIGYALNNWEALQRYVEQGYLAIDNNLSERTLRVVALGRNNWGVLGSETGGETAAVLYSVVQTCKYLAIDPVGYLREALPGLFALGEKPSEEQLEEWLPDAWQESRSRDPCSQGSPTSKPAVVEEPTPQAASASAG